MGVITGLMGSGKTTLLYHLFGEPPPDLYTSTGVAEQSFRGLLHHTLHLSARTWQRLSHKDIRELLAPLIRAGMRKAAVDYLASRLMHDLNVTVTTSVPTNPLDPAPSSTSATASVPSKTETSLFPTKSPPLPRKSPSCQEMVPLVQPRASAGPIVPDHLKLEMAHMIDTGGQPELMEVMPCLIHNADLAIALLNLEYSLSELQQVDYHEKGEGYKRKTPSRLSSRDIILKLTSTLHGKKSLHEPFRLLIVATHRDCVKGDLEARVETLNRELRSLLLPAFEKELLLFEKPNKIAFVLDLKNPDDSDKRALELIRREVGMPGLGKTFETPISFFVFEQDLLQFAESEAKRDILSLDECKTVGARLKMNQEMVVAALPSSEHLPLLPPRPPKPRLHQAPGSPRHRQQHRCLQLQEITGCSRKTGVSAGERHHHGRTARLRPDLPSLPDRSLRGPRCHQTLLSHSHHSPTAPRGRHHPSSPRQ